MLKTIVSESDNDLLGFAAAHDASSELLNLIARHKAASEAFGDAVDLQEEMQARFNQAHPEPVLTPAGAGRFYELSLGYDACKGGIASDFEEERKKLAGLARLDPAAAEQALAALDAKEAERCAQLDENFAAFEARREAFGLAGADRQYQGDQ